MKSWNTEMEQKVLAFIKDNKGCTYLSIAFALKVNDNSITGRLTDLLDEGRIKIIGKDGRYSQYAYVMCRKESLVLKKQRKDLKKIKAFKNVMKFKDDLPYGVREFFISAIN